MKEVIEELKRINEKLEVREEVREDWTALLARAVGAGYGDKIQEFIARAVPLGLLSGTIGKAIIGYVLQRFGGRIHELVTYVGEGMLIDAVGDFIKGATTGLIGMSKTEAEVPKVHTETIVI